MGGQAFAHLSPPLQTPRMPPEIYKQVLRTTHVLLQHHYRLVGSPIQAPGKDSFGDVDILILDPLPFSPLKNITSHPELATQLSSLLGAKHHILEKGNPTMNFAIPWPRSSPSSSSSPQEEKYIQLDIKICESEKMYNWEIFHAAHGDLRNILGSTIRKFGLTVNNLAMYLRIPEVEALDRKKSMIFLTDDHKKILEFVGLEPEKWWKEFSSREDMFEYAAGCRMFWVKDLVLEAEEADDESPEGTAGDVEGLEGGQKGKKALKHNDRARMAKRPIFREWMDEFIPKCRAESRFMDSKGVTREQIREEAFATFGSEVKEVYETRLSEWKLAKHTDEIWRTIIKGSVPEDVDPQFRAASIRTLKRVVMDGEEFDGAMIPEVARNEEGYWDMEKLRKWVIENWKKAGDIGWSRQQEKAREGMRLKAEKKRVAKEEAERKKVRTDAEAIE